MESWDVVIIGGGAAALRAAIACADAGTIPALFDGAGISSSSGDAPVAGIAASFDETDSTSHRDDTIAAGGDSTDKVSAARICGEAVSTLAELERWGLVLRRRDGGLPYASANPGHSTARVAGCGDGTTREVVTLLEEQVMKRGIIRRTDIQPLSLAMDNKQVRGLIALDIQSGEVISIQAKAVILATEGHQGLFSHPNDGAGVGASLAASAGVTLRGMSNNPTHPLTITGTNLHLPMDTLGSGGRLRSEDGSDIEPADSIGATAVLDLRALDGESKVWFSQTARRVRERTGLDIERDVIPVNHTHATTTGGAPVDANGRITFKSGASWFTGLYAAGRSANTGMHGAGLLSGNLLLEDLVSGAAAGAHAGDWAKGHQFGGSSSLEKAMKKQEARISALIEGEGTSLGETIRQLTSIAKGMNGNAAAIPNIAALKKSSITLDDDSKAMNTELLTALKVEGLIDLAEAIAKSS